MKYVIDDKEYEVIISKKNNKNTYLRFKDNKIYISTNYFVTNSYIKTILNNNINFIRKMIKKYENKIVKDNSFYYLNNKYDIEYGNYEFKIKDSKIYVKDNDFLNKWLSNQTKIIFKERLDYNYNLFEEKIPFPNLKIRKMKTRWGVCNKKNNNVTLNSDLIKYGIDQIDYVIIHELSHFVYFDHSKLFWNEVSKYCPNYKEIQKILKS